MQARSAHALVLLLAASACVTTSPARSRKPNDSPWLQPSARLQGQIDEMAQRLPYTHGEARIEQIHWFARVGEPAYPVLLALATDPRPDVAGSAWAAMGATGDSRLVAHLRALPMPADAPQNLTYERARTLLRLGDWSEAPALIGGLRDPSLMIRALCARALHDATGQSFGFDPQAEESEREAAVQSWEQWWRSRQVEGVLSPR